MVKFGNVWRSLGWLNDTKLVTHIWQLDFKILAPKNHDFDVSQFCDQVVKFVWRVWCHLVNLTIVTHSQTSPSERSHSSDIDSRKNGFKIRQIDLQNTKTKSSPKNSWWYHGQQTSHIIKFLKDLIKIWSNLNNFGETWFFQNLKTWILGIFDYEMWNFQECKMWHLIYFSSISLRFWSIV